MKIAIVDYGLGNIKSVKNALEALNVQSILTHDKTELTDVSALILPGVGAFGDGMKNIHDRGLYDVIIKEAKDKGKPLLGICLGMQLLADGSDEFGEHKGLELIPGWVKKLKPSQPSFKVPHIGWNDIETIEQEPLLKGLEDRPDYYFVHSYYFEAKDEQDVSAWCDYDMRFPAVIQKNNVMGTQFHPEKSQRAGFKLLENFCAFAASC